MGDGGLPGIGSSRAGRSWSMRGIDDSRPSVYGISGCAKMSLRRARLDDAAAVHDGDLVGDVGDDAEVVGDDDDRGAELAPGGP